jgi:hypothetical protein
MESLREIFFKTDRSTQKLSAGRTHYSIFDIYPPLEDSLFQSFFFDQIGHFSGRRLGCILLALRSPNGEEGNFEP